MLIIIHQNPFSQMARGPFSLQRWTAAIFEKSGCTHLKSINKPNFDISPANLTGMSTEVDCVGNRFVTQIWVKGGRKVTGDEGRVLLDEVCPILFCHPVVFFPFSI
jgi:hypothetical protein